MAGRDYFVRWAALPDLFSAFDAGLWEIGQDIARQPADQAIYLTPRETSHPTLTFAWTAQPHTHGAPVSFDGRHIFPLSEGAAPNAETYVTIEPEDFRTRLLLPELFPAASIVKEITDPAGQVYARYYMRPADTTPARMPQHALNESLGDGIVLAGYDVQPAQLRPGETLYLQLHWLVDQAPSRDWTVFTHLLAQVRRRHAGPRLRAKTANLAPAAFPHRSGSQAGACWMSTRSSCQPIWRQGHTCWRPASIHPMGRGCRRPARPSPWAR